MIKHLRFFMLNLLVLVSAAVMGADKSCILRWSAKRLDKNWHSCKTNPVRKTLHTAANKGFYHKPSNDRSSNQAYHTNNKK